MALRADERRDKLRKASGRSKYPLIRRSLNGETHMSNPHVSIAQYIREVCKSNAIHLVYGNVVIKWTKSSI